MNDTKFWNGHVVTKVESDKGTVALTTRCGQRLSIPLAIPMKTDAKRAAGPVTCGKCQTP